MLILVSGASADVARTDPARVGVLVQPRGRTRRSLLVDRVWAVDNGAYAGFDEEAFTDRLCQLRGIRGCKFVACPDVVGNCVATIALFAEWAPRLRARGWPVALVAQDGLLPSHVPWDDIDALFIGGTTGWKLSTAADLLLLHAGMRRIWRHVGRVNSRRRMRHFLYRCDSIDGSGFSTFPKRIWMALDWLDGFEVNPRLEACQ